MYFYIHRVQFYETDQMGIVHHSNYVRFCEEARVDWAHKVGIINYQEKDSASQFAVIAADFRYLKPAYFGDELKIEIQARLIGPKIIFEYKIYCFQKGSQVVKDLIAEARTMHVSLNKDLRAQKPNSEFKKLFAIASKDENYDKDEKNKKDGNQWIETWLLNL